MEALKDDLSESQWPDADDSRLEAAPAPSLEPAPEQHSVVETEPEVVQV